MPTLKTGKECCGCTACKAICPTNAISMEPDCLGFKYPKVDYDKCIECKACERVCAFNKDYDTSSKFSKPLAYGVRLKKIDELMRSRSGGGFVAFSDWVLNQGGVVYGAGYKGHFVVSHKRAVSKIERDEFRGSKYVQSDLDGIFRMVKDDLGEGKWVLFSGTPCQVAGLSSYIPQKYHSKLVTVDIVCHGVPSPSIWKDYLAYIEQQEHGRVKEVDFRDKIDFGWSAHKEMFKIRTERGEIIKIAKTGFTFLFYKHIMNRPSCSNCYYCNLHRPSDLTLADFWGWEKTGSDINKDDRGLSLILINSELGKKIFDDVKESFNIIPTTLKQCMQPCLERPFPENPKSAIFKYTYSKKGFAYIFKRFGNEGWRYKYKCISSNLGKRIIGIFK